MIEATSDSTTARWRTRRSHSLVSTLTRWRNLTLLDLDIGALPAPRAFGLWL